MVLIHFYGFEFIMFKNFKKPCLKLLNLNMK